MYCLKTAFPGLQTNRLDSLRSSFRVIASLVAIASIGGLRSAIAEEPAAIDGKSPGKAPAAHAKVHVDAVTIPVCMEKLKLTSHQQDQIKVIVSEYDTSLNAVWKSFSERYMQAIMMETSLLAAIEDNFTDTQRQQVRDLRHKTAQHEKAVEATTEKPNQATVKPNSAVEDEVAGVGVSLTSEQEVAADKVQEKYRAQLRSINRDVQGLHIRLVSLEADKLVAFEKVLTKEQLVQLRLNRQTAPEAKIQAISKLDLNKPE